jgi:hypothetical protein
VVIILVIVSRFWIIRDLDAPMWGDSYQHTVITQLIIDHDGLFASWQPYAELETFSYHFGFHSLAAAFYWITGLPVHEAVLWMGQILNCMAVLFLFPLALRIQRARWGGIAAILLAGLWFQMPMFYTNWGRYTQLAGQALLPAVICLGWGALETKPVRWQLLAAAAFALGGLILTHYRVAAFAILFYLSFVLCHLIFNQQNNASHAAITATRQPSRRAVIQRSAAITAGGVLLALPWLANLPGGNLFDLAVRLLTTLPEQASTFSKEYNAFGNPLSFLPVWAWIAMLLSAGWGLWQRKRAVALIAFWWFFIFVATNPQMLALPGAGIISNFTILAAAYIPASLLIGTGAVGLVDRIAIPRRARAAIALGLFVCCAALALLGGRMRLYDILPYQHALVTHPDLRAAAWISANLPADAHLLVNAFPAFGGSTVVGSDGGWWLPLFSRRQTMLPPLNYGSERGSREDYQEWANQMVTEVQAKGIDHPDVLRLMEERGINYLYIGQRHGLVNSPVGALLNLEQILSSPNYQPVYHQDRVWIFERLANSSP